VSVAAAVYAELLAAYGAQRWWPARGRFEVMVGAVLTQNTAWRNVEQAIAALRAAGLLTPESILAAAPERLAGCLRPAGYYNLKARRLRNLCRWFVAAGGWRPLRARPTQALRAGLLGVHGVGPETADAILLYAFDRPVLVVDAYLRRLWRRLALAAGDEPYGELQRRVGAELPPEPALLNEFHALVVCHGKRHCRVRPLCAGCPLEPRCPQARASHRGAGRVVRGAIPAGRGERKAAKA